MRFLLLSQIILMKKMFTCHAISHLQSFLKKKSEILIKLTTQFKTQLMLLKIKIKNNKKKQCY